jgi:zinc finger MYND domain-containing protein 10
MSLDAFEASSLIQNLKKFSLQDVGTPKWLIQHESIERLNIQAHKNVQSESEEYITESILTHEKVA